MLPDLLDYNLLVVFCGTAAGTVSAERKRYFAGKGNKFWKTLYEVGLTPSRLEPAEYKLLLEYGIGLAPLVDRCKIKQQHQWNSVRITSRGQ